MRKHTKIYLEGMGYNTTDWIPCEWCGGTAVDVNHIEPRGMGGKNRGADVIENLVGMCRRDHLLFEAKKISKEELKQRHYENLQNISR